MDDITNLLIGEWLQVWEDERLRYQNMGKPEIADVITAMTSELKTALGHTE